MAHDRANDPSRRPSFNDIDSALHGGKITFEEAVDLNGNDWSRAHKNVPGSGTKKEVKRIHKNAGLKSDW